MNQFLSYSLYCLFMSITIALIIMNGNIGFRYNDIDTFVCVIAFLSAIYMFGILCYVVINLKQIFKIK